MNKQEILSILYKMQASWQVCYDANANKFNLEICTMNFVQNGFCFWLNNRKFYVLHTLCSEALQYLKLKKGTFSKNDYWFPRLNDNGNCINNTVVQEILKRRLDFLNQAIQDLENEIINNTQPIT